MNCIVFGELLSVLLHNKTCCTAEATNYDSVSELHLFRVFKLKTLKENKRSKECENENRNIKRSDSCNINKSGKLLCKVLMQRYPPSNWCIFYVLRHKRLIKPNPLIHKIIGNLKYNLKLATVLIQHTIFFHLFTFFIFIFQKLILPS